MCERRSGPVAGSFGISLLVSLGAFYQALSVRMPSQSIGLGAPVILEVNVAADAPDGEMRLINQGTTFRFIKASTRDTPKEPL